MSADLQTGLRWAEKMKLTFASLWLLLAVLIFEANSSQAGHITIGERLAGSIPALASVVLIPAVFVAIVVLFVRNRKRVIPTPVWWLPVVVPLVALVPLIASSESQDAEAKKVLTRIANLIKSPARPAMTGFNSATELPRCTEPGASLSLNHSTPFLREYSIWLQCGNEPVQEIRVVRKAEQVIVTSVFTPRSDHVQAFSGRTRVAVPI